MVHSLWYLVHICISHWEYGSTPLNVNCKWIWFYDQTNDILERMVDDKLEYFMPYGVMRMHSERVPMLTSSVLDNRIPTRVPCMTVLAANILVNFLNRGPQLAVGSSQPNNFWAFLPSWSGSWMWSSISNEGIGFI